MLHNYNLRNYLAADFISQFGSNLAFFSLHWHVLTISGSNTKVGIAVFVGVLAGLVTCLFAGIITDIFCRKKVILVSNFLRAIAILLSTFLMYQDHYNIYYLYIFFIIGGIGFNIYIPATKAFLQEIVPKDKYLKASGFLEFNVQFTILISSFLSGLLYKHFGIYFILCINIISFLLSNFFIYFIKHVREFQPKANEGFFDKISLGISYFINRPWIFMLVVILLLPQIASIGQNIVLPGYVANYLGENSYIFGLINMMYGIGASLISLIFIIKGERFFRKKLLEIAFLISITSLGIIIMTKSLLFSYIAIFLFGFGNASIKIFLIAYMMKVIDKEYMGRAISIKNILITILQMFTSYNIGIMMDLYGDIIGYLFLEAIMLTSLFLYCLFSAHYRDRGRF